MKDIGLATVHYERMKEELKRAQEECEKALTIANITRECACDDKLWAFKLGLECAGILEEVEEEWRKRHEHD